MPYADLDKRRDALRRWRENNPDKQKTINARRAPKEKEYRQTHLAQYAEYQRQSRRRNARQHLVIDARGRAKKAGLPCTITVDDIIWPTHCPIFGSELVYIKGSENFRRSSVTLDRRTNELGYVPGNVFAISHRANRIKSDATIAELEAILAYMKGTSLSK